MKEARPPKGVHTVLFHLYKILENENYSTLQKADEWLPGANGSWREKRGRDYNGAQRKCLALIDVI